MRADLLSASGPPRASHPLLVASGKGGVGTSVAASLVALTAADRGERVLLVDATEAAGTIHQLFGARPERSLWQLASPRVRAGDVVIELHDRLSIVPGGTSGGAELPGDRRRDALARVASLFDDYDLVVIDGGSRLDALTTISELLDLRLLLITSADRFALAANYAVVKSIGGRMSHADRFVLANRHAPAVAIPACEFLSDACEQFLSRSLTYVGAIPDDACLQAAVGAGMSVQDALDGAPAAVTMRGILSRFVPLSLVPPLAVPNAFAHPYRRWS